MTLTVGHHKGRALSGDYGFAGTGTKQVAVLFEFLEGDCQGSQLTWYGFFTPATAERSIEGLRNAGCTFPKDDLSDLSGLGSVECVLVVEEDGVDDNGYPRLKIRWVNKLGGGVALGARMTDAEKRSFAEEMRGYVAASRPAGQPAAAPPVVPAPRGTALTRTAPARGPQQAPAAGGVQQRRSMNTAGDAPPY